MLKAYKYRIYPTSEQAEMFAKTFGCVRVVYNWGLELKSTLYKEKKESIGLVTMQNRMRSELKEEKDWLKEVNSQSLQMSLRALDTAYTNFFKNGAKYPNFKSKHDRQSFHCPQHVTVDFEKGIINIPKVKGIRTVFHRKFKARQIKDVTISKERDGRYYASILTDCYDEKLPKKAVAENTAVGIDTGLKTFAVCSNGTEFPALHSAKDKKRKLKLLSRQLSKKKKGSSAFNRIKLRISRLHSQIAAKRADYLHKITYQLTHENQVGTICVEDLNVRGMIKNKHLAYDISDAGIGMFYTMLAYKCDWYGINYVRIGRFLPSSKQCHICGYQNKTLRLKDRSWICPECGTTHDRDFNASVNIRNFGLEALRMERAEVKPVEYPLVDDRSCFKNLKSKGTKKQEKRRNYFVSEAAKSLA